MADKTDTVITIAGKSYTLSGVESEEYLQEVAEYLNGKIKEFTDDPNYWKLPNDQRTLLLQLNLADDYFKEKEKNRTTDERIAAMEKERDDALQKAADTKRRALKCMEQLMRIQSESMQKVQEVTKKLRS